LAKKVIYYLNIQRKDKRLQAYIAKNEVEPDLTNPFIFFPLHMQPEESTLPRGGVFVDQLEIVRLSAASLPDGVFLYVKEHVAYWGRKHWEGMEEARSREYYDTITALKNVRLINHEYNSLELIKKCLAVVAITGTAGFEALFMGIPVLVFADPIYSIFPGAFRIRSDEDCKAAIKRIMNGDVQISTRDLRMAIKAVEPFMVTIPYKDKGFIDCGGETVSENDRAMLLNCVARFARDYYGIAVKDD
jgi:hypothetical protein